jgi:hypothetical protein
VGRSTAAPAEVGGDGLAHEDVGVFGIAVERRGRGGGGARRMRAPCSAFATSTDTCIDADAQRMVGEFLGSSNAHGTRRTT